jgi:hypothetical protein
MSARAKAIAPLAIVIGILSYLWTELSLNFTFHWVTVQDNLTGDGSLGLPENFHLILPTAFISWGLFFAAGGDNAAFGKIFLATVFGSVAALVTMPLAWKTADAPDFWGIALWVGIFAFVLVEEFSSNASLVEARMNPGGPPPKAKYSFATDSG